LRNKIKDLRKKHPGWGPQTILIELQRNPAWNQQSLPSRSRIALFLKEEGMTRSYLKASEIVQPEKTHPTRAHQIWELDAQTDVRVEGLGKVGFIHIVDKASRLKIESTPLHHVRKPATKHYMLALRRAFLNWGRPEQITLDRDTVFFDNTYPSPFPTMIHRWLIALGVEVSFSRPRQSTDHAQIERSHRTMTAQSIEGQTWETINALWQGLDERREVLNQFMPCLALGDQAPLDAFPDAAFSGRGYWLENEPSLLSMERLFDFLSEGVWFRVSPHGGINLGGQRYWISTDAGGQSLKITFNRVMKLFEVRPEKSEGLFMCNQKR
jgi:hypothetical protein